MQQKNNELAPYFAIILNPWTSLRNLFSEAFFVGSGLMAQGLSIDPSHNGNRR